MLEESKKLYEGKAKVVYAGETEDEVYIVFKDSATAFDGKKKGIIQGKGYYNAQISAILFQLLEEKGVKTHFLGLSDDNVMKARRLKIYPVEVVVRNIVAGSLAKRMGRPEGEDLPFPIVEYYYKSDELGDPMVNQDHIVAFGLATPDEIAHLGDEARKINSILKPFFLDHGLLLVDFKLEFGRVLRPVSQTYPEKSPTDDIVLADEISPDTCRFWDVNTREKLDKDRFRRDLGGVEEAYQEVLRRLKK